MRMLHNYLAKYLKMRLILDNIIFSLQKVGGVSGVWSKLVEELLKHPELDIKFLERDDARQNIFRAALDIPSSKIIRYGKLPLCMDRYMPVKTGESSPYIFHSPYYRFSTDKQAKNVVTLHDFIYEEARVHPLHARTVHKWQKSRALKHAEAICCVSNATLTRLHKHYPHIKTDAEVIYNPVVCDGSSRKLDITPYLLYVGSRDAYKNFEFAAKAAANSGKPLIIAGAPLTADEKKMLGSLRLFFEQVIYPSPKKLASLYGNAFALLYPSSNEGFGVPIIEAQSHGCPVIISNCDSGVEVGGNAAMSVLDLNVNTLTDAIAQLNNTRLRNKIINAGLVNARRFSSSDTADQYISLYKHLLTD